MRAIRGLKSHGDRSVIELSDQKLESRLETGESTKALVFHYGIALIYLSSLALKTSKFVMEAHRMLPVANIWLARCCEPLVGVREAALFLDAADAQVAAWPDPDANGPTFSDVAAGAIAARCRTVRPQPKDDEGTTPEGRLVAIPIELGGRRLGVLGFDCSASAPDDTALEAAIAEATRWLPIVLATDEGQANAKAGATHALLTRLFMTFLEPEEIGPAYVALVSEIATALACDRVSLGFLHEKEIRLEAVSHSARFDPRTRLGQAIAAAMEEAVDAEAGIRWPGEDGKAPHRAHATLCQAHEMGAAFSVPLTSHGAPIGAICAEYRNRHPAAPVIAARMEQLATILGPLVALRRTEALPLGARLRLAAKDTYEDWTGDRRRGQQIIAGTAALVLLLLAVIPGTNRVAAPARLEGLVQRAIVAPIDGYVAESRARAGDVIKAGTVLGAIDDTDLLVERRKWLARLRQLDKEERSALAERNRSESKILRARLAQTRAELELVEAQLARTKLIAPFDGVVAEGDLSRKLGSPVARGDVLFQVAPLDRYRIVLEVDETEIDEIRVGQRGWLKLTSMPGDDLPLFVERVVPVATAGEGRNFFRVEASLEKMQPSLRPGMEGVGKIEVGRRSQLWIMTHPLVDWLRLRIWSWLP